MMLETEKQQLGEELAKMDRIHPEGEGLESQLANKEKSVGSRPPQPPPYSLSHHLRAVGLGLTNRTPLGPGQLYHFCLYMECLLLYNKMIFCNLEFINEPLWCVM